MSMEESCAQKINWWVSQAPVPEKEIQDATDILFKQHRLDVGAPKRCC